MPVKSVARPALHAIFTSAAPMEAQTAAELPTGPGWWFEPKWDGFRCLAFRNGDQVILQAKSGKSLTRFFPEVAALVAGIEVDAFALDGELMGPGAEGFSFEALQLRLHPAESRIRRLAASAPAVYALFDMLTLEGRDLRAEPFSRRRAALVAFLARHGSASLVETPGTDDRVLAQAWLDEGKVEGVVAKRLSEPYAEGVRAMVKVKRARTADCVVGGYRYATADPLRVGSLLLGLYDETDDLDHVGFTAGFAGVDRAALTRTLEALRGGPGFTGDAPGGPSRWATERSVQWTPVRPELVVEVSFDHVSGGRFRHGTKLLRLRPDKAPRQCRIDQIAPSATLAPKITN